MPLTCCQLGRIAASKTYSKWHSLTSDPGRVALRVAVEKHFVR